MAFYVKENYFYGPFLVMVDKFLQFLFLLHIFLILHLLLHIRGSEHKKLFSCTHKKKHEVKENFHTAHKLDNQPPKEFRSLSLALYVHYTKKKLWYNHLLYFFLYSITVIYLSSEVPSFIHVSLHAHTILTPSQTESFFFFFRALISIHFIFNSIAIISNSIQSV